MDTDTDSVSRWDDEDEEGGDVEENEEDGEHDSGLLDFQPVMTRNANYTGFSVGDARWSSASSAAAPPQSQNNAVSQTATGYAIPTAIAELASALMRQRSRYSDRVPTERNYEDQAVDRLPSERTGVQAGEGLGAGPPEGLDYDEPPHGNGGYYDYGYDREEDQSIEEVNDNTSSAPTAAHDFSPSAGVFHRHTLPFNLPDMGEMQMQRRASNNVTSTLATVSDAIY